jgi:hypothetical protein
MPIIYRIQGAILAESYERVNQKLWLSNHSKTFHYKESGWNRIDKSELCVTKSFKVFQLEFPIDWKVDPFKSKSWRLYFHSLDWLHSYRYRAEKSNDTNALEKAREIIINWWNNNSQPENSDEMAWDDHATANRLANLCIWYNLFDHNEEEEEQFTEIINFHCEMIESFFENGHWIATNHAIFHIASLVNVNLVFGNSTKIIDTSELARTYLQQTVQTIIHVDSGFSVEQSLFYHQFVMNEFLPLLELIESNNEMDSEAINICIEKMKSFLQVISTVDGTVPALGDTAFGFKVSARYRPITEIKQGTFVYEDSGLAIFRGHTNQSPNIGVFSFVEKRTSHGHFNPLDFSLIMSGEELLVDAGGSYAYGEPFRFSYIISNLAHNVVRVYGQNAKNACEYLSSSVGENSFVSARQSRDDAEIIRTVVSISGECFIVFDSVELTKPGNVELFWHFSPTVNISNGEVNEIDTSDNRETLISANDTEMQLQLSLKTSEIVMNSAHSSNVSIKVQSGIHEPTPQGWVTPGHRKIIATPCMVVEYEECNQANAATTWIQSDTKYQLLELSPQLAKIQIGNNKICEVSCINGEVKISSTNN